MRTITIKPVKISVSYSYALNRYFGWINGRKKCCTTPHRYRREAYDCAKDYNYTEL